MNDRGTPERWRHGQVEIRAVELKAGHATEDVVADVNPTVFDFLLARGHINERQLDAAIWLASLRLAAGLEPRQVSSYNPLGAGCEMTDEQAEARARFNRAIKALGSDAKPVLAALEGHCPLRAVAAVQSGLTRLVRAMEKRNI